MSDPELRGYDGFGAPIYDYQEDDMPTDLPPGFTGTGKPAPNPIDPEHEPVHEERATFLEIVGRWIFGSALASMGILMSVSFLWGAVWLLVNFPHG